MNGYKVFDKEMKSNGMQYAVGETYTLHGENLNLDNNGFSFSNQVASLLNGNELDEIRVCEIRALGVISKNDLKKTDKIEIIRELSPEEKTIASTGLFTSMNGDDYEYLNGKLHSLNDKPAVSKYKDATFYWYQNGVLHRDGDKPALVMPNVQQWYQHGVVHRDGDKPAEIDNGKESWYQHGVVHRDGDKPAVIDKKNGTKCWYQHGKLHRDGDEPAKYSKYVKEWYQYGKRHRSGGKPAIEDEFRGNQWFDNGEFIRKDY